MVLCKSTSKQILSTSKIIITSVLNLKQLSTFSSSVLYIIQSKAS